MSWTLLKECRKLFSLAGSRCIVLFPHLLAAVLLFFPIGGHKLVCFLVIEKTQKRERFWQDMQNVVFILCV
jgi:hypothetical protein